LYVKEILPQNVFAEPMTPLEAHSGIYSFEHPTQPSVGTAAKLPFLTVLLTNIIEAIKVYRIPMEVLHLH
jgi:hypothetical protein